MKTEASTALLCFEALGMRSLALNVIHVANYGHCTVETMNDSQGQRSCSMSRPQHRFRESSSLNARRCDHVSAAREKNR
jgi:hypothetical protein